jgi:hypothetical protein
MRWLILFAVTLPGSAQQTIFDVPSADVSPKGGWFYQHQSVVRRWNGDRRWIQTNAVGVGTGGAFEIDATWFNRERGAWAESAPSVGFKWSPRLNYAESAIPLRFVAGEMVQFRGASPESGHWSYAILSAEIRHSETHLTGGFTAGSHILFGERTTGAMFGIEQHLSKRFMLQADWFSGRHGLSYAKSPVTLARASFAAARHRGPAAQ